MLTTTDTWRTDMSTFDPAARAEFTHRFEHFDGYRSEARQDDLFTVFKSGMQYASAQEPTDAEQGYAAMDALGCELRVVESEATTCDLHGGYATENDVCEVVATTLSAARAARQEKR